MTIFPPDVADILFRFHAVFVYKRGKDYRPAQRTILWASPGAENLYGYPPGGMVGYAVSDLVPESELLRQEARQLALEFDEQNHWFGKDYDFLAKKKDGTVFPADFALVPCSLDTVPVTIGVVINTNGRPQPLVG